MLTRILSGIVLVILTASSLFFGSWYLFGLCLAISLVGMMELYRVAGIHKTILGLIGYISVIAYYACVFLGLQQYEVLVFVACFICAMTAYVFCFPKYRTEDALMTFFGVIYVGVMLSYIYQTRSMENGIYIAWLIFICSWGSDTFAYFSGVTFGKHKMAPRLSPKKSIEGAIGGVIGTAILGAIYGFIIDDRLTMVSNPILVFAVASAVGALLSMIGDLAASAIKRNHEIKDYGKIIPGHGGILDRYDSVIFTAPIVYWVFYILK